MSYTTKPPEPRKCPHCGFMPLYAVTVCKQCGKDYLDKSCLRPTA